MKYIRLKWNHTNPDEPVYLFSELNEEGREVRKIECFKNGFCDFANSEISSGTTKLSTQKLPSLKELARDPEFVPEEISREEFEDVWIRRRYKSS